VKAPDSKICCEKNYSD